MSISVWSLQGLKDPPPVPLKPDPSSDPLGILDALLFPEWVISGAMLAALAILVLTLALIVGHQASRARRERRRSLHQTSGEDQGIWSSE